MRRIVQASICSALLAALGLFYAAQIWYPSKVLHNSENSEAINKSKPGHSNVMPESSEEKIADYTWWLSAFTLVIGVSGVFQLIFLTRAEKIAAETAESALQAAKASNIQAEQMKRGSELGETQNAIIGAQTDLQLKRHAVSRLQFLALHRPRLNVRHVNVEDGSHYGHPTTPFRHKAEINGGLVVVNVGGSKAAIVDTRYRIFCTKSGLPGAAPYYSDFRTNLLLVDQELTAGEACATSFSDRISLAEPPPGIGTPMRQFENEGWVMYIMGQIRYSDEGGADRFMGFCRRRGDDGRFRTVDDPDYEYED
jgi:hypothetical protein